MKVAFWNEQKVMKEAFHNDMGTNFELNSYNDILDLEDELGYRVSYMTYLPKLEDNQLEAIMAGMGCTDYEVLGQVELWEDDSIQFPRLISELNAFISDHHFEQVGESMDLTVGEVYEIVDRADKAFQEIKWRRFYDES